MKVNKSLILSFIMLSGGILLAILLIPVNDGSSRMEFFPSRKRQPVQKPNLSEEDLQDERLNKAYVCISNFIDHYNAGLSDNDLEKIKEAFKKEYGFVIFQDSQLRFCVKDLQGAPVLIYSDSQ